MTLSSFLQLLINGISIGLIYSLVALGLVLVLGVAKVFNFAHGEFICWALTQSIPSILFIT